MKNIKVLIILSLLTGFFVTAEPFLTDKQQQIVNKKLKQEVEKHKTKIALKEGVYSTEYLLDVFEVDKTSELSMDIDYSTAGMVNASINATDEYDILLNKYYKKLRKKLNKEDRKILKQTQRNWVKYRDSELKLNAILADEKYSGGGTIQRLFVASRVLEITKSRLEEIYHYLNRIQ